MAPIGITTQWSKPRRLAEGISTQWSKHGPAWAGYHSWNTWRVCRHTRRIPRHFDVTWQQHSGSNHWHSGSAHWHSGAVRSQ